MIKEHPKRGIFFLEENYMYSSESDSELNKQFPSLGDFGSLFTALAAESVQGKEVV